MFFKKINFLYSFVFLNSVWRICFKILFFCFFLYKLALDFLFQGINIYEPSDEKVYGFRIDFVFCTCFLKRSFELI